MTRPASELAHLFRQLKAPAAASALPKLADRARSEEWSYEQFAAALLKTETDSRDSHGGQSRIKQARFPARKTLEEFDFAFQASLRRETVLHLGQLDFLAGRENIVLLGPPGTLPDGQDSSYLLRRIVHGPCRAGRTSFSSVAAAPGSLSTPVVREGTTRRRPFVGIPPARWRPTRRPQEPGHHARFKPFLTRGQPPAYSRAVVRSTAFRNRGAELVREEESSARPALGAEQPSAP